MRVRALAVVAALGLVAGAPARAQPGPSVIDPGAEPVIGRMLGAGDVILAGGCRLERADIQLVRVEVTYACPGGPARLWLEHPAAAPAGTRRTAKLAIVAEKGVPDALLDDVAARVAAGEAEFAWAVPARPAPVGPGVPAPRPPGSGDDPGLARRYAEGFELYRQGRHEEALAHFVDMAREHADYGGVLGGIVANLAPTRPDAARVAARRRAADATPGDPLPQFVAGVAAHYSAHYRARTRDEKTALYSTAIEYLGRARPAYDFEPRVFIYLAVSHFRLGEQAPAEAYIERAIALDREDPDAFYCRAEIWQRKDVDRALADVERYLELVDRARLEGSPAAPEKRRRVERMAEHLRAVKRGEAAPVELWDPLVASPPPAALGSPRRFAAIVGLVALAALTGIGAGLLVGRRRRRRGAGPG